MNDTIHNYNYKMSYWAGYNCHSLFDPTLYRGFCCTIQVLVNYARSSKEAEEVSKEVGDFLLFNMLLSHLVLLGGEHVVIYIIVFRNNW